MTHKICLYASILTLMLNSMMPGMCQEFNLKPEWIVVEEVETMPFPDLQPVDEELIQIIDSLYVIYRSSFEENYDSTLFFIMKFELLQDSLMLSISKHHFTLYDLFFRQYYNSVENRPFGSFNHEGILYFVENNAGTKINRFFKTQSKVNTVRIKSRKLLEPGIYNEIQTFQFKYLIAGPTFRLIEKKVKSSKLLDEEQN